MTKLSIEDAMWRALELALLGPAYGLNPRVGAVILNSAGEVLGEGFHLGSGTPHAEVVALSKALPTGGKLEPGCVAVVSLEPCNHTGKTPPCATALIEAGISKVVYAASDPGPISSGGAKTLMAAGIEVEAGLLSEVANEQLHRWLVATNKRRPFVTLKWASSLDGRAAANDGSSKWISSEASRHDAHRRRSEVDAILVGTGTVAQDNPTLSARKPDGSLFEHQPLRVILGERKLPGEHRIFDASAETIWLNTRSIPDALAQLYERGVRHLLVEGGPTVASQFIQAGLVDEYLIYLSPKILGGERVAISSVAVNSISQAKELKFMETSWLDGDLVIIARPKES